MIDIFLMKDIEEAAIFISGVCSAYFSQSWSAISFSPHETVRLVVIDLKEEGVTALVGSLKVIIDKIKSDEQMDQFMEEADFNVYLPVFNVTSTSFIRDIYDFAKFVAYKYKRMSVFSYEKERGEPLLSVSCNLNNKHCNALYPLSSEMGKHCFQNDFILEENFGYKQKLRMYFYSLGLSEANALFSELEQIANLHPDQKDLRRVFYEDLGIYYNLDYYQISAESFLKNIIFELSSRIDA